MSYVDLSILKKSIPIVEYATRMGYTVQKVGSYYTVAEHDSIRIDPQSNRYYRNSRYSEDKDVESVKHQGSIIDFVMEFEGLSLSQTVQKLANEQYTVDYTPRDLPKKEKKAFALPEKDLLPNGKMNVKNVYAYLLGTRCLNKSIVSDLISSGNLYQDVRKNCVFVSYDATGKANFGCLRSSSTNSNFRGDIAGSDYTACFLLDNAAKTTVVAESVIDLLSLMSDKYEEAGKAAVENINWLAIGGTTKTKALFHHLDESLEVEKVCIAFDSDEAGQKAAYLTRKKLQNEYPVTTQIYLPPHAKDWNQERCNRMQEKSRETQVDKEDEYER